ncbi:unnamed protein product, partial [Staurois parvus]
MIEWGQRMLKRTVCRSRQLSSESIAKQHQRVVFRLAQQCVVIFMKWASMAEQLHP